MEHPDEGESAFFRTEDEVLKSDVLSRIHTFDGPPEGSDFAEGSADDLIKAGLPRRPDPEREPRLAEIWQRHFDRDLRYVPAEVSIDTVLGRRDPLWRRPGHPQGLEDEASFGPSGWGGMVSRPGYLFDGGRYLRRPAVNSVYGEWTVPGIFPASDPAGSITAGFWVGIDGWGNSQVLQAGIAVTVSRQGVVEWWAWTEWWTQKYKDPAVRIDNFPISPGDTISVLVCAPSRDHGFAALHNLTTGQVTSLGIDQPGSDIHSQGATAEWIIEGISSFLPVFLPSVTFTSISGGTKTTTFDLIPGGFTTEIAGAAPGSQLTKSTIANDTVGVIQWKGWT